MTREPTDEQIEAMAEEAFARYAQARKEANEPLTTTPDPQSTGAEGEAHLEPCPDCVLWEPGDMCQTCNDTGLPGFSWEYRAVEPNGRPTEWFASPSTFRMCGPHWVRERRLVGPAERVEESQPGNGQ